MPRLPYAAVTLIEQVKQHKKRAKAEPTGEVDGLGVWRTIAFDKATSKWLAPLLDEIDDPRIEGHEVEDGVLTVTLSPRIDADTRDEFPLADAETVVGNSD